MWQAISNLYKPVIKSCVHRNEEINDFRFLVISWKTMRCFWMSASTSYWVGSYDIIPLLLLSGHCGGLSSTGVLAFSAANTCACTEQCFPSSLYTCRSATGRSVHCSEADRELWGEQCYRTQASVSKWSKHTRRKILRKLTLELPLGTCSFVLKKRDVLLCLLSK